ncbi:hypothetical protein COCCADRAFT_81499, partial [Bipolaris zeicola 26-R-13]
TSLQAPHAASIGRLARLLGWIDGILAPVHGIRVIGHAPVKMQLLASRSQDGHVPLPYSMPSLIGCIHWKSLSTAEKGPQTVARCAWWGKAKAPLT